MDFNSCMGLAGMKLTFFIAAHMPLCFAFGAKQVLVTPQGLGYCWTLPAQHQGFLSSPRLPKASRLVGWSRFWQGTPPGRQTQTDQRVFHRMPSHTQQEKLRARKKKGSWSWGWCLSLQASAAHAEALPARKCLDICGLMGCSEWVPYFTWLMYTTFAFPIKVLLSWSRSLLFFLFFCSLCCGRGSEQAAGWVFGCWLWSIYHNSISSSLYRVWGGRSIEHKHLIRPLLYW